MYDFVTLCHGNHYELLEPSYFFHESSFFEDHVRSCPRNVQTALQNVLRPSPPSGKLVVVYSAKRGVRQQSGLALIASIQHQCNYWLTTMVENQLPLYIERQHAALLQCYYLVVGLDGRTPRERLGKSKFTYYLLVDLLAWPKTEI